MSGSPLSTRQLKMKGLIQRNLGSLILKEVQDPRLKLLTISDVDVSRDLSFAKIYFSIIGATPDNIEEALLALKKASGFLRHQLGKTLNARIVPALHFVYDESFEKADYLNRLIKKACDQERKASTSDHLEKPEDV